MKMQIQEIQDLCGERNRVEKLVLAQFVAVDHKIVSVSHHSCYNTHSHNIICNILLSLPPPRTFGHFHFKHCNESPKFEETIKTEFKEGKRRETATETNSATHSQQLPNRGKTRYFT